MRSKRLLTIVALLFCPAAIAAAGTIGFIEDFSLADKRDEALKQLIPGTVDYYYYHCLHYLNTERFDKIEPLLKVWANRHNEGGRYREIRNRLALLTYDTDHDRTLRYLRSRLNLHFNHQREELDPKLTLPTALDQALISRERLTGRAMARHEHTTAGFEDAALYRLAQTKLDPRIRRHLLKRLRRPDVPGLVALVKSDLAYRHSGGFGSLPIHTLMLTAQLEALLKLKPDLRNQTHFVNTCLSRLRPGDDAARQFDPAVRNAHLDRLWAYVSTLGPVHNSLKACVLYHRLVLDRERGEYNRARFLEYITLPRTASYVNPDYIKTLQQRDRSGRWRVNLGADFSEFTLLAPVGNDEPLVRSYLMHFFREEKTWNTKEYTDYIRETYLKEVFAETKITAGLGDAEQWYSLLSPAKYTALKERVDIDFAHTNPAVFTPADEVRLDVHIKNVRKLIVKVFAIDELNFYRATHAAIDTTIDLDGLVANFEKTCAYDEPPFRRVRRTFAFPQCADRGVYVVELIGNGKSSRAVVRKGSLGYLENTGAAGHVFTILDESNRLLPDAAVYVGGRRYAADREGRITVPFSTKPGREEMIIAAGGFASRDHFQHHAERYRLLAGIHVEREALLQGAKARVLIRPSLRLNGTEVSLKLLEEVKLIIRSRDIDGVTTTVEVGDFQLNHDGESVYEFAVPDRLRQIGFTLRATVKNVSLNEKQDLAATASFAINGIDTRHAVADLFFSRDAGDYCLDLLGRNGEPKPGRPVTVELKHRDFKETVHVSLQTDDSGRVRLGPLEDIASVTATGPAGIRHTWTPPRDGRTLPGVIHGKAGERVLVPYMGAAEKSTGADFSLIETRGGVFVADRTGALKLAKGFLVVEDLPAGDYSLLLRETGHHITIRLTDGEQRGGYVLSPTRRLQVINARPLQITGVAVDEKHVRIKLFGAGKYARVHVAAARFRPAYPLAGNLAMPIRTPGFAVNAPADSQYVAGRDIGDEYRYILDRRTGKKYPGNMLQRPGLLLNPWAIRETDTGRQEARRGGRYGKKSVAGKGGRATAFGGKAKGKPAAEAGFSNLDFLAGRAVLLANLRPGKNGVVTIDRADLRGRQDIRIVACDPENTGWRQVSLKQGRLETRDRRLPRPFDPAEHFTRQKEITALAAKETLVIEDMATARFETVETLADAYALYMTLGGNSDLAEFGFILDWPELTEERKRELYAQYACHELSFFVYKKDPPFFENVVMPYLKNKRDKTFMDRWLLGADLGDYREPWRHGRLNVCERILLARRIEGERPVTARAVTDRWELIPPDPAAQNRLFQTAIKGKALDAAGRDGGFEAAKEEAAKQEAGKTAEQRRPARRLEKEVAARDEAKSLEGLAAKKADAKTKAPAKPAPEPAARPAEAEEKPRQLAEADKLADGKDTAMDDSLARGVKDRKKVRQFYRKMPRTKEWVENNYYHLPVEKQNAGLVTVNGFWKDFAAHDGDGPFVSGNLAAAHRSFTEIMLALAVLDLPFAAGKHQAAAKDGAFRFTAAGPAVAFHEEIRPAAAGAEKIPVLVSQNFFRHGDRYSHEGNEKTEKYVTEEFLTGVVYGCHVVVTNPTASRRRLDVLLQVPAGAIPVAGGRKTRSVNLDLQPYRTQTMEYYFYFPATGTYPHYPAHVAMNEKYVASADGFRLNVVKKLSRIDTSSWAYISQFADGEKVIDYLKSCNLHRIKPEKIAWRMKDKQYFDRVLAILDRRHVYNHTLYSYGIYHDRPDAVAAYLQHRDSFVRQCGTALESPLLTIDPVARNTYQHIEYRPLVNARAHRLGNRRTIVNDRLFAQYNRLLKVLSYRRELDDRDLAAVTCYLFLQDRVEEGLRFFDRINPRRPASRMQYDYLRVYTDFYRGDTAAARKLAAAYRDYPVDTWRKRFTAALAQLDEIAGTAGAVVDEESRAQQQEKLAETEPAFDFHVAGGRIVLNHRNLDAVRVNYYRMDIELLFSRSPFVRSGRAAGRFSYITPNATKTVKLDKKEGTKKIDLPEQLADVNVLVQVAGGGLTRSDAWYANTINCQVIENYGQLKVTDAKTGAPLPKTYVKVYARTAGGRVRFYKDGYTDLRGRFDYTSLNTRDRGAVERLALMVFSETHGAVVREAAPPKQ